MLGAVGSTGAGASGTSVGGISVGDTFSVYSVGEELIDPESGLSLGAEKTKSGVIEISSVQPKFSKAIIVSGGGFKRNDTVEAK